MDLITPLKKHYTQVCIWRDLHVPGWVTLLFTYFLIPILLLLIIGALFTIARAEGPAYCDQQGNCWYKMDNGTLYDTHGNYLYPGESSAAVSQEILAGLGAVPAGAHPKTILLGDENQHPGYYQTDPLSNLNRELKKLPPAPQEEQTVEERILEKIANGEKLTLGEQKIYNEVIKPQSKAKNK